MKIVVVGGINNANIFAPFMNAGLLKKKGTYTIQQGLELRQEHKTQIEIADLVIFTGGADVTPSIYNQRKGMHTNCDIERDEFEMQIYNYARGNNVAMLGICRGSQFLTAMQPGGALFQDIEGHGGHHDITLEEDMFDKVLRVSSTHHQASDIRNIKNAELLGYKLEKDFKYLDQDDKLVELGEFKLPEIVLYPNSKCLAVQGHPEYATDQFSVYVAYLVITRLLNRKIDLSKIPMPTRYGNPYNRPGIVGHIRHITGSEPYNEEDLPKPKTYISRVTFPYDIDEGRAVFTDEDADHDEDHEDYTEEEEENTMTEQEQEELAGELGAADTLEKIDQLMKEAFPDPNNPEKYVAPHHRVKFPRITNAQIQGYITGIDPIKGKLAAKDTDQIELPW